MNIGDRVTVNDQKPPAHGVIVDVKPWSELLKIGGAGNAVQVRCEEWNPLTRWIDENFIKPDNN